MLFVRLAGILGGPEAARARLDVLAEEEAEIVAGLPLRVAIH
jgi:hypothetical protein